MGQWVLWVTHGCFPPQGMLGAENGVEREGRAFEGLLSYVQTVVQCLPQPQNKHLHMTSRQNKKFLTRNEMKKRINKNSCNRNSNWVPLQNRWDSTFLSFCYCLGKELQVVIKYCQYRDKKQHPLCLMFWYEDLLATNIKLYRSLCSLFSLWNVLHFSQLGLWHVILDVQFKTSNRSLALRYSYSMCQRI